MPLTEEQTQAAGKQTPSDVSQQLGINQGAAGGSGDAFSGAYQGVWNELSRVSVRPPPFWPEKPAVWFAQIEGQFALSRITTDETKFYHVIAQLDHKYAAEVEDIITSPPPTGKYEKLKAELTKRLSASQERKIKQLLTHEELGDRKPSQFLRHLRHLAGPTVPNDFLKTIWTSRLPPNIQTCIASQSQSTLDDVADLADRIHDIAPPLSQVATTSAEMPGTALDCISNRVAELTRQVESLMKVHNSNYNNNSRRGFNRPHSGSHSGSRSRSSSRSSSRNPSYCFYHTRFGHRARNCNQPCAFKPENSTSSH